ncbi:MAG: hypothetical protein JXR76_14785 [Deltaproteobacteria bacterium]|nr:hypothetical protein [Deltaproteobacteria bacterium]
MSLRNRYSGKEETGRPSITCPHYTPKPGSKRCIHYLSNGACDRPDELMCVEWSRLNRSGRSAAGCTKSMEVDEHCQRQSAVNHQYKQEKPAITEKIDDIDRDLLGHPLPSYPRKTEKPPPSASHVSTASPTPTGDVPVIRNLKDEEISSFKELGVEVCIKSDDVGEIWMVPEYTKQNRKEISIEHAATLAMMCSAFPGARIVAFQEALVSNERSAKDQT